MARKRLSVEQIIQKLREAELELARGQTVTQVVKKLIIGLVVCYVLELLSLNVLGIDVVSPLALT